MADDAPAQLPQAHPAQTDGVRAAMEAIYNWNYESEIDQLRTLYANALERQWIGLRDLDWGREIDREAFSRTFSMGGIPIHETDFWKGLPADVRWQISRSTATFLLSQFLHGEQGALMVAAQLVNAVPHMDGKFYASTQTMDEARHVEVFAAYIRKLGEVRPIAPGLKQLLDNVLATESWLQKAVGMQVVTEGLALFSFRDMRNTTEEPLLREMLTYVSRDEARHTGYGIKYLTAVVPTLGEAEKAEIEDFAFESARLLLDSRAGMALRQTALQLWADAGVDPAEAIGALVKERERIRESLGRTGGRFGPIRGFVIPTLRSIGLFSERIEGHFKEMFSANFGEAMADFSRDPQDLPEDLEAWVNEGAGID
jgi:rubrerythrin